MRLPCTVGVFCRCWLVDLGVSGGRIEIIKLEGRYGKRQINIEQKSVV